MNDVSNVSSSGGGVSDLAQSSETVTGGMGKDDFMKLLITQLGNQDPLSPMKNEDFVAQLAQFSSLEQLVGANERLDAISMSQLSQSGASAVGFIGKEVRAMGDWVEHDGDDSTELRFELMGKADTVTVTVTDEDGKLVRTVELGGRDEGDHSWTWDGRDRNNSPVDPGSYTVEVAAKDANGNTVNGYPVSCGRITGVSYKNGYPVLLIGDHKIPLSDVIEIMEE